MDQRIGLCTASDGVGIAYATSGRGAPLVKTANWLTHLEEDWTSPVWRHWLTELSRDRLLVRYDERGCGLSDREVADISFDAWVRDLEAVVEATGLDRFPLLGLSQGAGVAIAYAVRHPERVTRLVLYGGYARGRFRRDPSDRSRAEAATMENLIALGWGRNRSAFRQVFANLLVPDASPAQIAWLTELQRVSTTAENALRIERTSYHIDVTELAAQVTAPTLVIHARDDAMIGFDQGRELATLIPDAVFVPLDSRNHVLVADEPAWPRFLSTVREFLNADAQVSSGAAPPEAAEDHVRPAHPEQIAKVVRPDWSATQALFDTLADASRADREARLAQVAAHDAALAGRVAAMLAADPDAEVRLGSYQDVAARMILDVTTERTRDPLRRIGDRIGRYRVDDLLGTGGMGVLYRATDTRLERPAVLKFMAPSLSLDATAKDRFLQEARAASSLDHPNICTIYEADESADGALYIAMAAYEGETVRARLERGVIDTDEALDLMTQAARGLAAAHQRGLVHRDIKPANLLVTRDGVLKILDFGVAKVPGTGMTRPDQQPGTAGYMAPEQARGDAVDGAADIWALGVVLHEMVTGERPAGPTRTGADPAGAPDRLPGRVRVLLDRMLAEDPAARPTAVRLAEGPMAGGPDDGPSADVQTAARLAHGSVPVAHPENPSTTSRTPVRAARSDVAEQPGTVAVLPFTDLSPGQDQAHFCEGMAEEILDALARVPGLRVTRLHPYDATRASSDLQSVGRRLGVQTVIAGSVRKAERRIRISARLIQVSDGLLLWGDRYDREMEDIFAIQEEIASSIVKTLVPSLTGDPLRRLRGPRAQAFDAYEHYLRGRQFFLRDTRRDLEAAREMFARAIELDPRYARAHAGRADACSYLYKHFQRDAALLAEADLASRSAVDLEPASADARTARAIVHWLQDRFPEAEHAFRAAIDLDPSSFEAHYLYGHYAYSRGDLERGIEQFTVAWEQRPDDFQAPIILGGLLRARGRADEAHAAFQRGLDLARRHLDINPENVRARYLGAFGLVGTGRVTEGLDWARRALQRAPGDAMVLYNVAAIHAVAGRADEALEYLSEAVRCGFQYRPDLVNDPDFASIRDHPDFAALLERLPDSGSAP